VVVFYTYCMMSFKTFMLGESPLMALIRDNPDSLEFGKKLVKAQRSGTIKISKKWPGAGTREAMERHSKYHKREKAKV